MYCSRIRTLIHFTFIFLIYAHFLFGHLKRSFPSNVVVVASFIPCSHLSPLFFRSRSIHKHLTKMCVKTVCVWLRANKNVSLICKRIRIPSEMVFYTPEKSRVQYLSNYIEQKARQAKRPFLLSLSSAHAPIHHGFDFGSIEWSYLSFDHLNGGTWKNRMFSSIVVYDKKKERNT